MSRSTKRMLFVTMVIISTVIATGAAMTGTWMVFIPWAIAVSLFAFAAGYTQ